MIRVELQEWMGSDRSIAEAAWTSSTDLQGKEKRTDEDVERVVKMLIEQKHASPIESVVLRFWIRMPIAIDRQHMTHRIASHNGMSGRYRTMPTDFFGIPEDVINIMARAIESDPSDIINQYNKLCSDANNWYKHTVAYFKTRSDKEISNSEFKRVREFLRGVLPQHNMTERITVMNLRSFANYQKLRNSRHAQPEIQKIAQLMLDAVDQANVCPIALMALKNNGWNI